MCQTFQIYVSSYNNHTLLQTIQQKTDSLVLGAKVSDEMLQNSLLFVFYREGVNIKGQK